MKTMNLIHLCYHDIMHLRRRQPLFFMKSVYNCCRFQQVIHIFVIGGNLQMEKKKFKMGLVPKLILAIILGILFGQFLPEGFCRLVVTLSGFFSNFLKFVIPLMILAYVTMGIADLSQGAGKLLLITVALAYGSTLIAGSASFLVAESLFPSFMSADALDQIAATAEVSLSPYFTIAIQPVMDTLSAVLPLPLSWDCASLPCVEKRSVIPCTMQ